ncbi:acyl carrier protein [Micromonospora sp. URMC 103]|uniref:acyl carrier protein n=1 Tax=Micromonospora sp. URMC 103 TaxID=3423406 RepID=UPI003F1D8D17
MAEPTSPITVHVPDADEVVTGLRDALTGVLDATDLAKIDPDAIGPDTPLLSLPIDSLTLLELMTIRRRCAPGSGWCPRRPATSRSWGRPPTARRPWTWCPAAGPMWS